MRNYLAHFHFMGKLLFLILPPLIVIFYFTTDKMVREYSNYQALDKVENATILAIQISALVHELQIERGMSAGYLGSNGKKFAHQLPQQRRLVDIQFSALKTLMHHMETEEHSPHVDQAATLVDSIGQIRTKVNHLTIPMEAEIGFYTRIITLYLEEISSIANHSDDAWLLRELSSFTSFLYAKERLGVERALGANIFATGEFTPAMSKQIAMLIAEQETFLKLFLADANPGVRNYYDGILSQYRFDRLEKMESLLLDNRTNTTVSVNPEEWFRLCTQKIDLYKTIHEHLTTRLVAKIEDRRCDKFSAMILTIAFDILLIVGGILILFFVSKQLYAEITEQQNLLVQQSKMAAMGEMIGAISHQWRQPLNAVGVLIQEIEMKYRFGALDEKELETLSAELLKYLDYMSSTIDDFRNFFKPDKQKILFDPIRAIQESLAIVDKQLHNHQIRVTIVDQPDHETRGWRYRIEGYESEFKQVMINLINNAKEAIEEHASTLPDAPREITISLERSGSDVIVRVRDTGGGIPAPLLPRIFDLYVSTKHEQQGTGLGLYMCKLIIERNMLGQLTARNINGGAEFEIILEAAEEE